MAQGDAPETVVRSNRTVRLVVHGGEQIIVGDRFTMEGVGSIVVESVLDDGAHVLATCRWESV